MKLHVEQLETRAMPTFFCGVTDAGVAYLDGYTYGDHKGHVIDVDRDIYGRVVFTVDGHPAIMTDPFTSIRIQVEGNIRNQTNVIHFDESIGNVPVAIFVGSDGHKHKGPHGAYIE